MNWVLFWKGFYIFWISFLIVNAIRAVIVGYPANALAIVGCTSILTLSGWRLIKYVEEREKESTFRQQKSKGEEGNTVGNQNVKIVVYSVEVPSAKRELEFPIQMGNYETFDSMVDRVTTIITKELPKLRK